MPGRVVGYGNRRSAVFARLDGQPAIFLLIQKQSGTNTVDGGGSVLARLDKLVRRTLPLEQCACSLSMAISRALSSDAPFEDIKLHLFLGGLLASLVVWLFIRNLKVTLIAALAIPTSIMGTSVRSAFGSR